MIIIYLLGGMLLCAIAYDLLVLKPPRDAKIRSRISSLEIERPGLSQEEYRKLAIKQQEEDFQKKVAQMKQDNANPKSYVVRCPSCNCESITLANDSKTRPKFVGIGVKTKSLGKRICLGCGYKW